MSDVPGLLDAAESKLAEAFKDLHGENNAWRQDNVHLREAVSATSAALAQVRRAIGHAGHVYAQERP